MKPGHRACEDTKTESIRKVTEKPHPQFGEVVRVVQIRSRLNGSGRQSCQALNECRAYRLGMAKAFGRPAPCYRKCVDHALHEAANTLTLAVQQLTSGNRSCDSCETDSSQQCTEALAHRKCSSLLVPTSGCSDQKQVQTCRVLPTPICSATAQPAAIATVCIQQDWRQH